MIGVPDLAQVRAWIQVPASAISDADLDQILAAELAIQARTCRLPDDDDTSGPATLTVTGYEATVLVDAGPPGRTYRILWGDATEEIVLDDNGDASASHSYEYAGGYPAAVVDVDRDRVLVSGVVTVPGDMILPAQGVYPDALARAVLRRCQREVAVRSLPLGAIGTEQAEYGPVNLPAWDAEIGRLEASYRIPVIA